MKLHFTKLEILSTCSGLVDCPPPPSAALQGLSNYRCEISWVGEWFFLFPPTPEKNGSWGGIETYTTFLSNRFYSTVLTTSNTSFTIQLSYLIILFGLFMEFISIDTFTFLQAKLQVDTVLERATRTV